MPRVTLGNVGIEKAICLRQIGWKTNEPSFKARLSLTPSTPETEKIRLVLWNAIDFVLYSLLSIRLLRDIDSGLAFFQTHVIHHHKITVLALPLNWQDLLRHFGYLLLHHPLPSSKLPPEAQRRERYRNPCLTNLRTT